MFNLSEECVLKHLLYCNSKFICLFTGTPTSQRTVFKLAHRSQRKHAYSVISNFNIHIAQ